MSDSDERSGLLVNASSDDHEIDVNQQATMERMMGFGSFSSPQKPKRQPRVPGAGRGFGTGANTQPIQPRTPQSSTVLSALSHPFIPASLPPQPARQSSKSPTPDPVEPLKAYPEHSTLRAIAKTPYATSTVSDNSHLDPIEYTNPVTGYTFTKRELFAYEKGVMQQVVDNEGNVGQVKVYFKPNFIDDNPWEQLEIKAGLKK